MLNEQAPNGLNETIQAFLPLPIVLHGLDCLISSAIEPVGTRTENNRDDKKIHPIPKGLCPLLFFGSRNILIESSPWLMICPPSKGHNTYQTESKD
jgi:hypothetical protein